METPNKKDSKKRDIFISYHNADDIDWNRFFVKPEKNEVPTEEEYHSLIAQMEEYTKQKRVVCTISAIIAVFIAFAWLIVGGYFIGTDKKGQAHLFLSVCALVLLFAFVIVAVLAEVWASKKRLKIRRYQLTYMQKKAEEDIFQNSIQTSYKYLDRYYDQTQRQAQQGFHITVFIAVCGALLIFGGVIAMYFGFIQPAYITCASGAITELISAIFFYLYNKTVTSMSRYHNKLVLSQNISFALRVADSLENNKDDAKLAIIKELVKDVNAQMMKSDADDDEPPKKQQSDAEKPSDTGTQS